MVRRVLIPFVGALTLVQPVWADSITLNPTADARILEIYPDANFGTDFLSTYNAAGNEQRTVIQFDLSAVPAGMKIDAAVLRLYGQAFSGSTAQTSIWAYRVATPWVEAEVDWGDAAQGTAWTNPGGDFVGTGGAHLTDPYGTWTGNQTAFDPAWYEVGVTDLVAVQYDGTYPNYGIGLAGPVGSELTYVQSETTGAANRPELVIEYSPIPEPASLALLLGGLLTLRRARRG